MSEKLLVITGTQRSGTSFMASFFSECGFDLGTEFWDEKVNGGLESPDICNHFRHTFNDLQFPFNGYWEMVGKEYFMPFKDLQQRYKVLKFSYLLSNPEFLSHWIMQRGRRDHFLIMQRPLEDVIRSKKTKPEFASGDSKLIPTTLAELRKNYRRSVQILEKHNIPHFYMQFPPDQNTKEYVGRIRRFSPYPLPHFAEEEFNKIYQPNKIQFK